MSPSAYRVAHNPAPESRSGVHFGDIEAYHRPDYGDVLPVEVKELAPIRALFLRHTGPYDQVGSTWTTLMSLAGVRRLLSSEMNLIGIAHDDPDVTVPDRLRYDAAIAITRPVAPEGAFGVVEIAGGIYATVTHKGPYLELAQTYQRLYEGWLPPSGYELRDAPSFELYLNSPMTAKPSDLLTTIHLPLH